MQIRENLQRVIFMLSTIVAVADCCSSRILLLREHHTLNLVNQQKFAQYEGDHSLQLLHHQQQQQQQSQEKIPQHVDIVANEMDFKKNLTGLVSRSKENDSKSSSSSEEIPQPSQPPDQNPDPDPDRTSDESTSSSAEEEEKEKEVVHTTDFITDATVREQNSGNPKYHVIDFYYTIMRDVLSFQCQGQFLTDFCLNGGRCFRYPVGNHSFLSCECADGYVGERCESKSLNELYIPAAPTNLDVQQPKVLMARIVFSFPMLIAISVVYIIIGALIVFRCPNKNPRGSAASIAD